ncbi:MAG TPA: TolC family protein [Thermoanaerobaculia bacterium]|nr:TolC family protein [Thermoanaerobaculia bacterium]
MSTIRRVLIFACFALSATALFAQTPGTTTAVQKEETATPPVTAETDKDISNPRALRLSLDDAIRTAASQNIGVQVQRLDYRESGQSLREAYGPFDWFTTADIEHTSRESPVSSQATPSASRNTFADFGVSQLLPTGGTYSINFNNNRQVQTGGFTTVSPAYGASVSVGLDQPLLRNFGIDINRRQITIARNTFGINSEEFRRILINTVVSTEQAYLNLVYARRFVDVQKEALFLARDQARITQIRINVGASAPLDILQPRVQIATTEEALIAAVAAVRDAEDQLRALLNLPADEWDRPIVPTDAVTYVPMAIDTDASVRRAMDLRPELRESQLSTANAKVQYAYARNQVRPKLDAVLNYTAAGLGGRAPIIDPATDQIIGYDVTGYPHALGQVLGNDFPSWTAGVLVGVPILNIGARAEAKRSELEVDRTRALEDQTRQNIMIDVRATARAVDTASKEITATRTAREAAEQNLDAERKRYENGMTTIFQVLQIQQQLSDARAKELQALVGYNQAVSAYHRAVGDLLDVRNIKVQEEAVEEPRILSFFDRYSWLNYDKSQPKTEEPKK